MSFNGESAAARPRIEMVSGAASESEAAAVIAAVEQFLADTAPPPAETKPAMSGWQAAALREGIAARQVSGSVWGHSPSWNERA